MKSASRSRGVLLPVAVLLVGCAGPRPAAPAAEGAERPVYPGYAPHEPLYGRGPLTPGERVGYAQTTRYADVVAFLDSLTRGPEHRSGSAHAPDSLWRVYPRVHVTTFGTTVEGRPLPLAVWGDDTTATDVRASDRLRVLVVANIHAGEVDGKEAALALLRDLAYGEHPEWADSLVLLVAPIYNADGNERVDFGNRPLQLGPVGGMGQRTNAHGLDLNRDFVKLAAPESRALLGVMRDYDPHVVVDLHTTDGTLMGYHLTYAPPLHPNTDDALEAELWDRWLPAVTEAIEREDGWAFYHYGNVPGAFGEPVTAPRGWYSFDWRPRFSTNYAGLRNRFGLLSESYSYAPFEERVTASRRFVEEVVDYAWANASQIRALVQQADAASVVGDTLALSATWAALPEPVEILLGAADTVYHPVTNTPMLQRRDVRIPETMPAFIRFEPTETERAPEAYYVQWDQTETIALLDRHGIRHEPAFVWGFLREQFHIDSVRVSEREFQGRRSAEVFGRWEAVPAEEGPPPRLAASRRVPLDQPLGRLAFALLEPRSDDGVVAWGVLPEGVLQAGGSYPILRVPAPPR